MKINYAGLKRIRIPFLTLFLTLIAHCAICQTVTLTEKKVNLIVRDLQVCDAVTIQRDILQAYNSSLTTQLNDKIKENTALATDRDKFKKRSNNRGKIVVAVVLAKILETAIILL